MNALITGASKGIGRAIAEQFAAEDYNLVLSARNLSDLERLGSELKEKYPHICVYTVVADCGKIEDVKHLADVTNAHFPVLDVLVNNVGVYVAENLLDEADDTLSRQMNINVYAAHYLCKYFGRKMRERQSGHIFNMCSVAGVKPLVNWGSYCVTKFALMGLTKVLREELMEHHVKVTAVLPGSTLTNSWEGYGVDWEKDRFVAPEDVASAMINALKMTIGANVDEITIRPVKGEIVEV
ncbi:MAG: SDR family oxidoreductase [Sphingobacteriaceae bacterium]|jgi:short-subunit dehydrogenase|nr:MAG: SDR family oxidoreductase [Pedobacter sp.]